MTRPVEVDGRGRRPVRWWVLGPEERPGGAEPRSADGAWGALRARKLCGSPGRRRGGRRGEECIADGVAGGRCWEGRRLVKGWLMGPEARVEGAEPRPMDGM